MDGKITYSIGDINEVLQYLSEHKYNEVVNLINILRSGELVKNEEANKPEEVE